MKSNYLVGIDIGTKKICTLIAQIKSDGEKEDVEIIGYGVAESRGLRKGNIVNMEATVEDIKKSIKDAELTAGVMIESAYVNISGKHVQSINAKGSINITGRSKEITREDLERAITHASAIMLPADRAVLHVLPQEYIVDSQDGIKNPVGMVGTNLDVYIHIITGSLTATKNLLLCLKKAKVNVLGTVLSHIATAEAVLTSDEKELGVLSIDIGGGTTDIAVFEKGSISYSGTIPLGGDNFTTDLSIGIRTAIDRAEKIKRRYGCAMDPNLKDETIEVPAISSKKPRQISTSILMNILKPRAYEIFEMVKMEIEKEGLQNSINAGVVISGGTALLDGILEVADGIFSIPVRVGYPQGVGGLIDKVNTPDFATAVGLIKYGFADMKDKGYIRNKPKNVMQKFKDYFGI
ncbi:MAG: cell division protein FtsA [Acidobacteria bacterium]|jgi:cell division protein FtsA|nr:cell division protein FtsA [Acidobacteriota bacterium]